MEFGDLNIREYDQKLMTASTIEWHTSGKTSRGDDRYARDMAELDYVFLADYAQVEGGKLSVLGASYTHANVAGPKNIWLTSVAGRVRSTIDAPPVELGIRIIAPGHAYEIAQTATLEAGEEARPYGEGKVGILFATTFPIQLVLPGLYSVHISIDGKLARTLAFDMSVGS